MIQKDENIVLKLSDFNIHNQELSFLGKELVEASVELSKDPNPNILKKIAELCLPNYLDSRDGKTFKTKILLALKSAFSLKDDLEINKWISKNLLHIQDVSDYLGEFGMYYYASKYKKITQDDYDIFIFDADKTLWDGESAYKFEEPITFDENTAIDSNGLIIKLKDGVREMLAGLIGDEKRVGLVSHSEKENVQFQEQPVIKLLKGFGILDYFNEMIVVAKEFPKSMFIPNEKRVIFIDDEIENIMDVVENTNADGVSPEDVIYSPSTIKESVVKTGTVKVSQNLEYGLDFVPLYVRSNNPKLKPKDEKYWEEKEREILDQYWYSSDKIESSEFQSFLDNMVSNGIEKNTVLELSSGLDDITLSASPINVLIKLTEIGMEKVSPNSYVEAGRPRIKSKEIPKKPKGKGEYQLDHKKPRWKGGTDTKDNLQWIDKKKHKEKTKNEGSYEYGGKDRHNKLKKQKGEEGYSKYQSDTGKAKVEKERKELGEKAFSEKQRERAKKRWKKSSSTEWDAMRISSWMIGESGPSRLTAGELNIIMALQDHDFFIEIINNKYGEVFMTKVKDLVWNLDELFADVYLMTQNEDFQEMCRDKSEKEGIDFVECLKREVDEYQVTSDKINDNKIVSNVVNFLEPRLRDLLDKASQAEKSKILTVFKYGAREIYKEALELKENEAKKISGISNKNFTDTMKFREDLTLQEFNDPEFNDHHAWRPEDGIVASWEYREFRKET